ncbi:MAG: hypothetical protein IT445_17535 [Phycisphaeraceae bacterium]|nr:hypothetical protein [Phycisphaeraceae bacterium]
MGRDYLPHADADMLSWMQAFANGIAARPSAYGLDNGDAELIQGVVGAFAQAYAVATRPGTRTMVTVNQKDTARNAAEQLCRRYYSRIKVHDGVSDAEKIAIGVRPLNTSRSRIKCPPSSPLLDILSATPGMHTLVYHDTNTPESKAKPFGATHLQLFVVIGDEPVMRRRARLPGKTGRVPAPGRREMGGVSTTSGRSQRELPGAELPGAGTLPGAGVLVGHFSTNPIVVKFGSRHDRKKATYFGRWVSRCGGVGPWSLPVSMSIAA